MVFLQNLILRKLSENKVFIWWIADEQVSLEWSLLMISSANLKYIGLLHNINVFGAERVRVELLKSERKQVELSLHY